MDPGDIVPSEPEPSVFNYVLSFLLVGVAWGFTTPFIRRAAADFNARQERQKAGNSASSPERSRSRSVAEPNTNNINTNAQLEDWDDSEHGAEQRLMGGVGDEEQHYMDEIPTETVRRRSSSAQRKAGENANATVDANAAAVGDDEDDVLLPVSTSASPSSSRSWLRSKIVSVFWTVVNLLRTPAYSIPLVINLTGSIWFFLLVGKHELSLTVPLVNSSAFLFTVLGEWYVDRKVIAKETWLGLVLVLGGIALCVHSKNQTV
ncbi:hypothetical protein N7495_009681 [Penicillium taxi]|uniref:uncharacterized protein n=1 Tax=Penicillium taxi TaxID=168475 RepID=UPI0025452579|nr:uncharacterized protein N7495_009681 [Penicillium taxi]KAJ5885171.1 hypothetical protein N7495_009681 [Penicillium taxi]